MRKLLLLFYATFFALYFHAQNCKIEGRITDEAGEAIAYASIYIPALAKGSMANIDGEYSFSVPCNKYQIQFQSLGYGKKAVEVDLEEVTEINIQLAVTAVQIREISVDPSKEDPAYNYIRKATAMAEYYKKQIKAYQCNLYVRSFYDPEKIPWIAKKLVSEEDLKEMSTGNISETLLEYSFERPNKVTERILAKKAGSVDTSKQGSQYINLNFYNLGGEGMINPLSRNAFQVYQFEHISTYFEEKNRVHKIKIIPRRKGNDLMRGFIYINDKIWNINNVDVEFEQPLAKLKYQQLYNQIDGNVWMPTNHKIKARVSIMGFEVDINYLATLSELKVETDPIIDQQIVSSLKLAPPTAQDPTEIPQEKKKKQSKTEAQIESLLTKEKISKTESLKLVRLIKKQERELENQIDTAKSFEIVREHKIEYADSAFATNDSLWQKRRDVPLSEQETSIYASRDSLEKEKRGDTVYNNPGQSLFNKIIYFDRPIKSKNKNIRFQPKGLSKGVDGGFNTVDGYWIEKVLFQYEWNNRNGRRYSFTPTVGYTLARKTIVGRIDYESQYSTTKRAGFYGSIGRKSRDFSREEPMTNFGNSLSSLLFKENYKKLYQADYLILGHQFDITNGFQLKTSLEYEDRVRLTNYSTQSLNSELNKEYTSNVPEHEDNVNEYLNIDRTNTPLSDHQSLSLDFTASYTPRQYYRIRNNEKEMFRSKYPTFELNFRQGLNDVWGSDANYQFLSFSIQQSTPIQLLDKFSYHVEIGKFLSNNSTYFADYKNFNAQPNYIIGNLKNNSFFLLDNYFYSTNEAYLEGHLTLEDNRLLLKRLPILNRKNLTESLNLNYLRVNHIKSNYTEVGYSLNRLFLLVNVGVYAAFEDEEFSSWGFRVGIKGL